MSQQDEADNQTKNCHRRAMSAHVEPTTRRLAGWAKAAGWRGAGRARLSCARPISDATGRRVVGPTFSAARRETYARHKSSLRQPLRDVREDLAIDMVVYGSDYLLGLSTFAPDVFAKRDLAWATGDPAFYELNDLLQYLGFLAFRPPVPAYKHSAAMFLKLRGWLGCDDTHPKSTKRPDSDREILADIVKRLPQ